jgi:hypothetical protein
LSNALESYAAREGGREPASTFFARISATYGTDVDLEAVIKEGRSAHVGPNL